MTIRTRLVKRVCIIFLRFRPIIGRFEDKSRAKCYKPMMFTYS
jgi:hypothetical protein